MRPLAHATRLGLTRGLTEFRHSMTSVADLVNYATIAVVFLVVLFFQRDAHIPGTTLTLGMATLPGMLGLMVIFSGMLGASGALAVEREDGTLLRCKALPYGTVGYLVGRIVSVSLGSVLGLVIVLIPGLVLLPALAGAGTGWLTLVWVVALGLLALLPWGAMTGSLARSPQAVSGLNLIAVGGITAVSGIFYPITALPAWLQAIGQVFPVYWLGLGMRSALLPSPVAELGGSWRHLETAAVLGAWAVAGLLLAPPVLRRMARGESGAAMQARRERALTRVG